jgi:RHS repeat-associated protein
MSFSRKSYTERRRQMLARKVDRLDKYESRNMITESLGLWMLGIGLPASALAHIRSLTPGEMGRGVGFQDHRLSHTHEQGSADAGLVRVPRRHEPPPGGGNSATPVAVIMPPAQTGVGDWFTLSGAVPREQPAAGTGAEQMLDVLKAAKAHAAGGGAAVTRGGSGTTGNTRGAITPLRLSSPAQANNANLGALGAAISGTPTVKPGLSASRASVAALDGTSSANGTGSSASSGTSAATTSGTDPSDSPDAGSVPPTVSPSSIPYTVTGTSSPQAFGSFTYWPLYVIDWNDGVTMLPGAAQYGVAGAKVDLRAQVSGATGVSFSWNTTNLSDATGISGTLTYDLTFTWSSNIPSAATPSVTLTATDGSGHMETQTYDFVVPASTFGGSGGTSVTWPTSLAPNTVLDNAAEGQFPSHYAAVDSNSGALDTSITLPTYNPNIGALALTYDSLTADPRPIVVFPHQLDPAQTVPTKVSAQLTFNSGGGTTYYYDTSNFIPGDIQQIALQANATGLSTGRYNYTGTIADIRSTTTTTTISGTATILNYSGGAIGNGWTVQGLEQITSVTGGVILDLGDGGKSLWFASSGSGGSFTTPAGDFSTLSKSGSNYVRTLTDGTKLTFNSSGQEISSEDTNSLFTTYTYSGGNLTSIEDPYTKLTTFTYSGGVLQSIEDPAARFTTFTHSSGNLTGVTMPDNSTWGYAYDGSNRLTQITDPRSKVVTVSYDSAERVGTISLPDTTTQEFSAYQEQGWTNSGTLGSPASATLLAAAPASFTDQLSNVTQLRPDWNGLGETNTTVDPLGNVATIDRNSNGLATVVIDRINRYTEYGYDTKGNVASITYMDTNKEFYTYNSFSEATTFKDALSNVYTYTYDSGGNLTVIQDPLHNLTTMTYTADGMLQTKKDPLGNTTSYAYDSQDRLTTVTNPDTTTELYVYDAYGNVGTYTDERSNVTVTSHDAMNRATGVLDALTNRSTFTYDSGGNLTVDQEPLSRTTSYAYDSMNRLVTVTNPLTFNTIYGYDLDGRVVTVKDPLGRVTTMVYDADGNATVLIDPRSDRTTTVYDGEQDVIQVTDPLGRITTTAYNNRGWVATVTDPLSNIVTYGYTATGKTSTESQSLVSGGASSVNYFYDADDRLIAVEDALSHYTTYTYDSGGNTIGVEDANSNTTSYAYDSRNRLTTVTDALGHTTVYGYDGDSNQITLTDGLSHTTTTAYDPLNRATTVTDALNNVTVTGYDSGGRVSVVVDPNGNRTSYAYDANDNVTTLTTPIGTSTYVYDSGGQLIDKTDAHGRRTTFAYNNDGQETNEAWLTSSGGTVETITFTYDSGGELTAASNPGATLSFAYDSGGNQITAVTSGGGTHQPNVTLTYGYDPSHNRISLVDSLSSVGTTIYSYDSKFRLTTIAQTIGGSSGPQVVLGYDPGDRLTSEGRMIGGSGTNVTTSLSYDPANRLTTLSHQVSGGAKLGTYVYQYDQANRVTTEVNTFGSTTIYSTYTYDYAYDKANELTAVSGSRIESYSYDSGGNRTGTGYATGSDNEMTSGGGYTYAYDAEGNLISETQVSGGTSVTTYSYDYHNELTGVTQRSSSGGTIILQATYTYDAFGRRIGTNVGGAQTWMVYDGQNPYAQLNGSGTLQERYLFGPAIDEIFARTSSGGTTAWYLTDRLGSVRNIVDTSGNFLDTVTYDSFGNVMSESDPANGDQFKFTGMQYDSATSLYYDNARYYVPNLGRFGSEDPTGFRSGDPNLYRYAHDDPSNASDPTGLAALSTMADGGLSGSQCDPGFAIDVSDEGDSSFLLHDGEDATADTPGELTDLAYKPRSVRYIGDAAMQEAMGSGAYSQVPDLGGAIYADPDVRATMLRDGEITKNDSMRRGPNNATERGGWILWNPTTGDYVVSHDGIDYPANSGKPTTRFNWPTYFDPRFDPTNPGVKLPVGQRRPIEGSGYIIVGFYHTHPNSPKPNVSDLNDSQDHNGIPGWIIFPYYDDAGQLRIWSRYYKKNGDVKRGPADR